MADHESDIWGRLPVEEVHHNPEEPLPESHVPLLADLLRYSAEVMLAVFPKDHPMNDAPPGTEMDHWFTSAFENAVALLEDHALAVHASAAKGGSWYRLAVPRERFLERLQERHGQGHLTFDDFNRALYAPLHLAEQTDQRGGKATIARIIEGLRSLGLVDGPPGGSVWVDEVLHYVWFSSHGKALEGASYSGANDFERFLRDAM